VGWIPEEWEVKTLNHIGQIYTGGTPSTTNPEYWDGDINWIIPSEVTQIEGPFLYSSERKITEKGLKNSSAKVVPENSIIVCTRATIGNCVINKVPIATNQGFKSLSPYEIHDVKFIYYSIVKNKNNLLRLGAGSTFLEVSRRDFERIRLAIPPLSEQQKIAEILSTWDRAIEQTRQLIEAKRRLKKGLMQQLLTGRMRFPGFGSPVEKRGELPEGWERKKINKLGKVYSGGTPSTSNDDFWGGDIAWVTPNEVTKIKGPFILDTKRKITKKGLDNSSAKLIPPKSIIVCTRATIGDCVINKIPMATNQGFKSLRPSSINDEKFIYYSIVFNKKKLLRLGAGSTYLEVSRNDFKKITIKVPNNKDEQENISNTILMIDIETLFLERKIDLFKEQKKGLMQKLLTGEVRV
jgi:type I restriction enzyme S subunit